MKPSTLVGLALTTLLLGCTNSRELVNQDRENSTNGSSIRTMNSYSSVAPGDSTRPGGTRESERDSVKGQIRLVTLVLIIVAAVVLAFTLGTAGKGG